MKELLEQMDRDVEEYGQLHGEECPCNMEDPDACDCEEMKAIKSICTEHMKKVEAWWIEHLKAHRPYCNPEGNKDITRLLGKKNRNIKSHAKNNK